MSDKQSIRWFQEARFGLFIHWGLYSLLEDGEWVMYNRRIPVKEYEKLAARFNPTGFDAREWVRVAKAAGMKYLVITAKHHDGFSMFRSAVSPFNIVDATPFGRDPMKELCEACKQEGIKLGFYYSHVREWRHPMAQSFEAIGRPDRLGNFGNFWDYPDESKKNLQRYIDEFDIPQLRELLTQYGDILTIWFDTPSMIRPDQAEQLKRAVYALQPVCLVNSRLSFDIETDYRTMGDCEVPASGTDRPWDTPMTTTRGAWGYAAGDSCRPAGEFIRELCEVVSKGGNYLLNVGPDARGIIPADSVSELKKVGNWLAINGDAIYGCGAAGLCYRPSWGCVTRKENRLYLIVFDESAARISLTGIGGKIAACRLLGSGPVSFQESNHDEEQRLAVDLGGAGDTVRVVEVLFGDSPRIVQGIIPADDGSVQLDCVSAVLTAGSEYSHLKVENGSTRRWLRADDTIRWTFRTPETACYDMELILEVGWVEDLGHEITIGLDGQRYPVSITPETAANRQKNRRIVKVGRFGDLPAGEHTLDILPAKIDITNMVGLTMFGVRLIRAGQ